MKEQIIIHMGLLILLVIIWIIIVYITKRYFTTYKNGLKVDQVIKVFNKNLYRCNSWGTRTIYDPRTNMVSRRCPGEFTEYNMITGKGFFRDTDFDGCSIPNDWGFKIGKSKKTKKLTIIRYK